MARFSVAVRRDYKNSDGGHDSDFISCIAYGKTGEMIGKYFHKGSGIIVIGRIQTGSYESQDGKRIYTTDIVVENIEFDRSNSEKKEEIREEKPVEKKVEEDPFEKFGQQLELNTNESYPWD